MIIVTGSDERYFELAKELILSIKACWPAPVPIGFVDLGVLPQQRAWLVSQGVLVEPPRTKFNLDRLVDDVSSKMGYLARPFINEIFSGHAMYVWLDADVWLQSWDGIQRLHDGAAARGAAMARENEKAYRWWMWMYCWQIKHLVLGIGSLSGAAIWLLPHINNGVFAMRADAPHWTSWRKYFQRALNRTQRVIPYDQISLNAAVYLDQLPTAFMPATCNWIVGLGHPMWNSETNTLCAPYPPFAPISNIHLAGPVKTRVFDLKTTKGAKRSMRLRFDCAAMITEGGVVENRFCQRSRHQVKLDRCSESVTRPSGY